MGKSKKENPGSLQNKKPNDPTRLDLPSLQPPERLKYLPNLLMIAGTGRKVGKTTLACRLIGQTALNHKVTAIKISPHFHEQAPGQKFVAQSPDFVIIEESNPCTGKDSSRMLAAGAEKVFYVQTNDQSIQHPLTIIFNLIPENVPVICESGALLNYARPGLFLLVRRKGETSFRKGMDQLPYPADAWVTFDGDGFEPDVKGFQFDGESWVISK